MTLPKAISPRWRVALLISACLGLAGLFTLGATGRERVPLLEAGTMVIWALMIQTRRKGDGVPSTLARAGAFALVVLMSLLCALFITYVVIAEDMLELDDRHVLGFVLFAGTHTEAFYAWNMSERLWPKVIAVAPVVMYYAWLIVVV